jgi:aminopeptidase N
MNLRFFLIFYFVNSLKSQRDGEDFLLPNSTRPESYTLFITTNASLTNLNFGGVLSVNIKVLENTKEIFLHSRGHQILDYNLYEKNSAVQVTDISLSRVNNDVIKITSEEYLTAGMVYDLLLRYSGNLLLESDGFFRSDYVVNEGGRDVNT